MLNVSALLLDDALKPATPLTNGNGAINENQLIFDEVKAYKNYAKFLGHTDVTRFSIVCHVLYTVFTLPLVVNDKLIA